MKIQYIFNKVINETLAREGIALFEQSIKSINYTVSSTYETLDKTFSTYQFKNDAVGTALSIREQELIPFMKDAKVCIVILGSDSSNPRQSNPVQYPINKNGCTLAVIPEHWYGKFSNVLHDYLLHELAHAGFYFKDSNRTDIVHEQQTFPEWQQKQISEYQIFLLKGLKPFLDVAVLSNTTSPLLRKGSTGEAVRTLQRKLKTAGYFSVAPTGTFGPLTDRAVKSFQKAYNLVSDGVAGLRTQAKLDEVLKKKPSGAIKDIELLDPKLIVLCILHIALCKQIGIEIVITETFRTGERQAMLYAQGRTTPGKKVTNAKKGKSLHEKGLAYDFAVLVKGKVDYRNVDDYYKAGHLAETLGLKWGGRFGDNPHIELKNIV